MKRIPKELLKKMDRELLLEELKYINTLTIYFDNAVTKAIVFSIGFVLAIYRFYNGDIEVLVWIKNNVDLAIVSIGVGTIIADFTLKGYIIKYKKEILELIMSKKHKD